MSGTVWTKFYWSDWESDPALRLCSLAAQGLWMRMLCIASAHDPIGYVAVAGRGLEETSLARMTGCSESEVRDLLPSLTAASVNATGDPQSYLTKAAAAVAKRRGCMEGPAAPNPSAWGDDEWRAAVEIWGESGAWSDALGPPPDQPGTRVPPSLRPRPMKAE